MGFEPSRVDPTIYVFMEEHPFISFWMYLNDMLMFPMPKKMGNEMIKSFADEFEIRESKRKERFMGISIVDEGNSIQLHSELMIETMLAHFNVRNCKPAPTPLPPVLHLPMVAALRRRIFLRTDN